MGIRCLTNNPKVLEKQLPYVENIMGNTLVVLKAVKYEILKGYKLITHPLTSSIRPNVSPYKSIILTSKAEKLDSESLDIIEKSIVYTTRLINGSRHYNWDENSLRDFQYIDFDLIKEFLQ